jgi:hypothetical protein
VWVGTTRVPVSLRMERRALITVAAPPLTQPRRLREEWRRIVSLVLMPRSRRSFLRDA